VQLRGEMTNCFQESWTPLQAHFKVPEGVRRVSNLVAGVSGSAARLDIGQSVHGKGALPHYT
jgi:homogentisate 1,2-dioxygenase